MEHRFPEVLEPGPRQQLLDALRLYAGEYAETSRHSAQALSLHVTDANALVEILWAERLGDPLSPARLAQRVGLTSGATNALVNRLETAGYAARSREHTDRRQVTLRATDLARERTQRLLRRPAEVLEAALDQLGPDTIATLNAALPVLTSALAQVNSELAHPG
ncbi:MarR family winged helix-turn-helix transcriptional regulator [Kineosporia succinea]|uniref:DNA-binding MarR family transcriptional regulator n=1 Tax=Kineosporia succinea TaxID=84632 RepID=A0ABT9PDA4_9ACTN|nr:MarR family transcriptional regulator [Kineosporia succinea]MDP9830680.1 DNA-binding MarR family transcriptional regulator [Kineosporia succinea]